MWALGLTGGIGSGKSSVARRLRAHGATILDADLIARRVVEPGSDGLVGIVRRFGQEALDADGQLRRKWLGGVVFSDPEALADLNALLHPMIRERLEEELRRAAAAGVWLAVIDAALLIELGLVARCDRVAVVSAPVALRIRRIAARDGLDERAARARMRAQLGDDERRLVADHVIDNSGGLQELDRQVDVLWGELEREYGRGRDGGGASRG